MTKNTIQSITSTPLPPVPSRFTRPARDAGLLVSSSAIGSLTGALVALMFSNEKDRGRMLAQGIVSGALTGSGIGAVRINTAQNRDTASLVKELREATSSKGASDPGVKSTTKETTTMNIEQLYRAGVAAKKTGSAGAIGGAIGGAISGGVGGALSRVRALVWGLPRCSPRKRKCSTR